MRNYLFIFCLLLTTSLHAADLERGKDLHDGSCINCHASMLGGNGTGIYTRPDRRIESLTALQKQVQRCRDSLGMPWPSDQVDDVVYYLNKTFYKFED